MQFKLTYTTEAKKQLFDLKKSLDIYLEAANQIIK